MPNLTIRLSEEDMGILDRLSTQWSMTRSDVVRKLIRDFDNALREVREETCKTCSRLAATYLFESMLLNPMVVYNLINSNRDIVGDRDFIVGWVITTDHRVFFSHADDLGRYLLKAAREYVKKYYGEEEGGGGGATRAAKKPQTQPKLPVPKAPTTSSCYRVVVAYPDGTRRDVAEELHRGCRDEETIEITPEDYQRYLRNEVTLDELIRRYRGTGSTTNTATGDGSNTQTQPNNPQQPQTNKQVDLRNLPYLTLGVVAMRLGVPKLPSISNRNKETRGGV
jgi:hypothetical protein